jgi:STE24 endopeptidase
MKLHRRALIFAVGLMLCCSLSARASETPAEHAANVYAAQEMAAAPTHGNLPDYSLSPDKFAKMQSLVVTRETLHFVNEALGIVILLLLLGLGVLGWMRDKALPIGQIRWLQAIFYPYIFLVFTLLIDLVPAAAVLSVSRHLAGAIAQFVLVACSVSVVWRYRKAIRRSACRWVEGYVFLLLFLSANFILALPLDVYEQHLQLKFGFSVQSWPSYFGDAAKSFALTWVIGGLLLMLLFWVIRKFPRRWWLVFWGVSIPLVLLGIFVSPYFNVLFDKFEPLQLHHPELVAQLEQVVEKGHMDIPPERMFLMKASEKVTTLNAYVTGFGASKRVVVWDTSIAKGTPDEVLFIFGHESGHYVLGHIVMGVYVTIGALLLALLLGYLFVQWAIARFGVRWRIPAQGDWAALGVLLLAFSLLGVIAGPIQATFSRQDEHAADVYGQEAIHGLVADPQTTARDAFDVLGANSLADPNPNLLYEFWTFDHPAIGRRAAFAKDYNPWAPGVEPKYFRK